MNTFAVRLRDDTFGLFIMGKTELGFSKAFRDAMSNERCPALLPLIIAHDLSLKEAKFTINENSFELSVEYKID